MDRVKLDWHVQHASFHPKPSVAGLLHFARTPRGTFEIFEDGPHYLLHFPRAMKLPAELFPSLDEAKGRAALEAKP